MVEVFIHTFMVNIIMVTNIIIIVVLVMAIIIIIIMSNQGHKMEISQIIAVKVLSSILKYLDFKTKYLLLAKIFKYSHLYLFLLSKLEVQNIWFLVNI